MPYQYRQFKRLLQNWKNFDELDLYFYKPKCFGVGVKARYDRQEVLPLKWKITNIEIKVITNLKDILGGKTAIEKWKKIVSTQTDFELNTRAYIQKNPKQFGITPNHSLESALQEELERVSKIIATAFRKNEDIQQALYQKNEDLRRWVNDQQKLADVFMVEKDRRKFAKSETGVVRATPLFGIDKIAPEVFQTLSFEGKSEQKLVDILKKEGISPQQNTSYPKLLENIYFKLI